MRPQSFLLAGPTASGKTALALSIAARTGAKIVNADALQVYDCWQILSARPSPDEVAQAEHLLFGHVRPMQEYSVGHWLREIKPILETPEPLVIVGGTGLYFSALSTGLADIPPTPPEVRAEADGMPHGVLLSELSAKDPETAARIDTQNPVRVQRAWEVLRATGKGLNGWQAETAPPLLPLDQATAAALMPEPAWLDARIALRFDQMVLDGALEEVASWKTLALPDTAPAAQALGRRELQAYLDGEITLDDATEQAVIATRQYAKRQRTWVRSRFKAWQKVDPAEGPEALTEQILRT